VGEIKEERERERENLVVVCLSFVGSVGERDLPLLQFEFHQMVWAEVVHPSTC